MRGSSAVHPRRSSCSLLRPSWPPQRNCHGVVRIGLCSRTEGPLPSQASLSRGRSLRPGGGAQPRLRGEWRPPTPPRLPNRTGQAFRAARERPRGLVEPPTPCAPERTALRSLLEVPPGVTQEFRKSPPRRPSRVFGSAGDIKGQPLVEGQSLPDHTGPTFCLVHPVPVLTPALLEHDTQRRGQRITRASLMVKPGRCFMPRDQRRRRRVAGSPR